MYNSSVLYRDTYIYNSSVLYRDTYMYTSSRLVLDSSLMFGTFYKKITQNALMEFMTFCLGLKCVSYKDLQLFTMFTSSVSLASLVW